MESAIADNNGPNSPDTVSSPYEGNVFQKQNGVTGFSDDNHLHRHSEEERKKFDTHFPRRPSPSSSPLASPRSGSLENDARNTVLMPNATTRAPGEPQGETGEDYESDEDQMVLTDAHRQAMQEVRDQRLDLGYTETDPPEYDVTERIRQLNEELALDPTPGLDEDDEREHSIKFKDNPVTLVVPPPEFEESEDELGFSKQPAEGAAPAEPERDDDADDLTEEIINRGSNAERSESPTAEEVSDDDGEPQSVEKDNLPSSLRNGPDKTADSDDEVPEAPTTSSGESSKTEKPESSSSDSRISTPKAEKVLVERNGKFELVDMKDLTPEERELYVIKSDRKSGGDSVSSSSSKTSMDDKKSGGPQPPRSPKPTVPSHRVQNGKNKRIRSAQSTNSTSLEGFDYNSPYALTPQQKKQLHNEKRAQERKLKEAEQKKKEEEEDSRAKSDEQFRAWLNQKRKKTQEENKKKREEELRRREIEQEQKEKDDRYRSAVLREWLHRKQEEKEKERRLALAQRREQMQSAHTSEERQKAFRQWLRAKDAEKRQEKEALSNYAKINRLKSRKAHKSQQLAKAISFAQGYSYTDYYGYRF